MSTRHKMNVNLEQIEEIYDTNMIKLIKENINDVNKNIAYLNRLQFTDIENMFERYPEIFIYCNNSFVTKMNNLINKLGPNYVEQIEENLELLEELL